MFKLNDSRTRMVVATVILMFSVSALAARPWEVDAGLDVLSHGLNRVSKDDAGTKGTLGTTFFNLDFQVHAPISTRLSLSPRLIWMPSFLFPHKDTGSETKTSYLIFGLPLVYELNPSFDLSGGLALLSYNYTAPGGTTTLNNGNGTAVFAIPGDSVSAKTIALIIGGRYTASEKIRISVDTFTEGALSSTKRTFSLMGAVTYAAY